MGWVLLRQALGVLHELLPIAPVFELQATSPLQELFSIVAPVLLVQEKSPTQALFPTAPVLLKQAWSPLQALFLRTSGTYRLSGDCRMGA